MLLKGKKSNLIDASTSVSNNVEFPSAFSMFLKLLGVYSLESSPELNSFTTRYPSPSEGKLEEKLGSGILEYLIQIKISLTFFK